ncbi:MAG: T6SS effector amidase Tae4 family protein [Myxococcota bacterium]
MSLPSLDGLYAGYPRDPKPCTQPYRNQCAIRMSIAFNAEGTIQVNRRTYDGTYCRHGHARGAEHLAGWLSSRRRLNRPLRFRDVEMAKLALQTMSGIIFFRDCFPRQDAHGRKRMVGDHIDLWVREARVRTYRAAAYSEPLQSEWARDALTYNDPRNESREVWFWPLA